MALQNRKTVMAIKEEVTEGTPILPTSATLDYIPLQDGFSVDPAFDSLDNAELTGSIGVAQPVLGFENPSMSISHYLKHSGVEGTEPNFGLLFNSLLGDKSVASTEYDTVGGSTAGDATARGTLVLDSGEGVQFERGRGVLIKDPSGYRIRNVFSVSTDTLNLGFNIPSAPALGVNLGKSVLYKPANELHPSFTSWVYRANGGATEMVAGTRVTDATIDVTAGEMINTDFSLEGIEYYFNPIEILAADTRLDWTDDAGTFAATITAKMYKDPHELASALEVAMNALTTETITVTYSNSTGKYTIATSTSSVLSLLWFSGANTANTVGDKIGFSVAADDTAATTYTSDSALSFASPQTPSYNSSVPIVAKDNEVLIGGFNDYACFAAKTISANISGTKSDLMSICATSGKSGSIISERGGSIEVTARLEQYDVSKFKDFREGNNVQFSFNVGKKSGGNWQAGLSVNYFVPTATITEFALEDEDGIIDLRLVLTPYVANGLGEVYINFL